MINAFYLLDGEGITLISRRYYEIPDKGFALSGMRPLLAASLTGPDETTQTTFFQLARVHFTHPGCI